MLEIHQAAIRDSKRPEVPPEDYDLYYGTPRIRDRLHGRCFNSLNRTPATHKTR